MLFTVIIFGQKLGEEQGADNGHFELVLLQRDCHHTSRFPHIGSSCTVSRKKFVKAKRERCKCVCVQVCIVSVCI